MIAASCSHCQAKFNLKDELAGKKGKCPNCMSIFLIPSLENSEGTQTTPLAAKTLPDLDDLISKDTSKTPASSSSHAQGIFKNHTYGIKQKRIAINEKYYIKDAENSDIFFSIRRIFFWRRLGAIFGAIVMFLILIMIVTSAVQDELALLLGYMGAIMGAIAFGIYLSPKRSIEFFFSEKDAGEKTPEFIVTQDKKLEFPTQNYTLRDATGKSVATFSKNVFTDILRKTWHVKYGDKHIMVKEDSIILGLMRRLLPFGNLIRTNFIFTDVTQDPNSSQIIGYFKRKFEIFDNYLLDLSTDPAYIIPRQYALCVTVLLDTGEKR